MNDATLTELKIVVERAVRPVRATFGRKRTMREELLGHLISIFEEEVGKLGNEPAALERANQRFGDPKGLTSELQQSVPAWDRYGSILETLGCQPGESAWHLAAKHFLAMVLFYSLLLLSYFLLLSPHFLHAVAPEARRFLAIGIVLGVPAVALMNVFLSVALAPLLNKIGPRIACKRRRRFLLVAMCGAVLFVGLASRTFAGAAILLVVMARQAVKQWRYQADWAQPSNHDSDIQGSVA